MHHEKCGRSDHSTIKCGRIERLMYQAEKPYRMSDSTMIQGGKQSDEDDWEPPVEAYSDGTSRTCGERR